MSKLCFSDIMLQALLERIMLNSFDVPLDIQDSRCLFYVISPMISSKNMLYALTSLGNGLRPNLAFTTCCVGAGLPVRDKVRQKYFGFNFLK